MFLQQTNNLKAKLNLNLSKFNTKITATGILQIVINIFRFQASSEESMVEEGSESEYTDSQEDSSSEDE